MADAPKVSKVTIKVKRPTPLGDIGNCEECGVEVTLENGSRLFPENTKLKLYFGNGDTEYPTDSGEHLTVLSSQYKDNTYTIPLSGNAYYLKGKTLLKVTFSEDSSSANTWQFLASPQYAFVEVS